MNPRVAVVGAGIVGSSIAWHLARRGATVLIVDAAQPGGGATSWSFAWVNASSAAHDRAYYELRVAALDAYRELAASSGADGWWYPSGHLAWADPSSPGALHGAVERLRSWGYDAESWDAARAQRLLEPSVRFPSGASEVAFFPREGWVDGRRLVAWLINEAVANGAEPHFGQPLTAVVTSRGRVAQVVLAGGEHHAVDAIVNAAGAAGGGVAALVGRALPLRDAPGAITRLGGDADPLRRSMHAPHVDLRPDGPGRVVAHSLEVDALIGTAGATDLGARLHRLAANVVPALGRWEVIEAGVGWRPMPVDGLPSVGAVEGIGGYYEAVMHSGVTLAAIVGRVLTAEIIDGAVHELVAPYRPDRFRRRPAPSP